MRNFILVNIFLFIGLISQAQTDSLIFENPSFTSILIGSDNLYAINKDGRLTAWNLTTLEKVFQSSDTIYTSIAKDKGDDIFLGTEKGTIFKLNQTDYSIKEYLKLKKDYRIDYIFFNSSNEIFLIVPYAVYDPVKDKYWNNFTHEANGMIVQKRFLFFFNKRTDTYFDMPQYTFIDSKDRIWMTKSFGEFGGSLQLFDTKNRKVLKSNIDSLNFGLLFPKSVFEDDNQNIFITSGLQHFINSGEIYKIENMTAKVIYNSKDYRDSTHTNHFSSGIFVGPGIYNSKEQKIYFATTNGFYRMDVPINGKIKSHELIFTPDLSWEREPLAIGVGMTIKKLVFTNDNRLVFLTSNNGIGIIDGQKTIMLK
ncbi:MAG: hypothetical protein JEY97_03140 [Bacteroidales bacterium]|nr:hypothetical protein [Bacteroidales bacterium]